jgi:hypothetical protein
VGNGQNISSDMHLGVPWRWQMHELKNAFTAEYVVFFIQALDTTIMVGGITPRGLKVMQRVYALLTEAKNQFDREFDE